MVGPSITDEERAAASTRLKAGFVVLVGLSGGLVSLQVEPTPLQVVGAVAGGLAAGALLLAFLVRLTSSVGSRR